MTNQEFEEGSKYIYGLLGCDYYENLSSGAECYLEKVKKNNNTALYKDFLIDLSYLDTNICNEYGQKQTLEECAKAGMQLIQRGTGEYDPIESTLMNVIYHKMYPNCEYTPNQYHPVRFYATFGIIPELETFEKIKGEQLGGGINAWDKPEKVLNAYKSLTTEVMHPSRKETMQTLEQQQTAEQITIFDLMKGGE